ncbi:MAG: sporulation transcription factor Spo0A [Christensenellaceae bacterium]|nr:sporulation transcription factor Spo0A [Christensenellaceae bacterium]
MQTVVIADDNTAFADEIKKFFSENTEFKVLGVAGDGVEAIKMVERMKPDFLLLDIVMPELDGFGVLSALGAFDERPVTIMISQLATDAFVTKSLRLGASYFMAKPVNYEQLYAYMREMNEPRQIQEPAQIVKKVSVRANKSLDERIANIFISVGIPAHIKGYQFLREAIKMVVDTPDIINNITKKLYPSIADKFETSSSKVERAIRHAIEVAWNRGKIENINSIFGIKVYTANDKPTNGEFIALVADKMILEGA